jgi:hypothetical protein
MVSKGIAEKLSGLKLSSAKNSKHSCGKDGNSGAVYISRRYTSSRSSPNVAQPQTTHDTHQHRLSVIYNKLDSLKIIEPLSLHST